jgi:hypothetical protein
MIETGPHSTGENNERFEIKEKALKLGSLWTYPSFFMESYPLYRTTINQSIKLKKYTTPMVYIDIWRFFLWN